MGRKTTRASLTAPPGPHHVSAALLPRHLTPAFAGLLGHPSNAGFRVLAQHLHEEQDEPVNLRLAAALLSPAGHLLTRASSRLAGKFFGLGLVLVRDKA